MDSQDILDRAYCLLTAGGIARDHYARDAGGQPISVFSNDAVSWCAAGAVHRAAYDLGFLPFSRQADEAWQHLWDYLKDIHPSRPSVTTWNDSATDQEILDTFRKLASPTCVTLVNA